MYKCCGVPLMCIQMYLGYSRCYWLYHRLYIKKKHRLQPWYNAWYYSYLLMYKLDNAGVHQW